jgi:hypothetical protein
MLPTPMPVKRSWRENPIDAIALVYLDPTKYPIAAILRALQKLKDLLVSVIRLGNYGILRGLSH